MAELIFPKRCYTARSSGYKYRTLSTNTGERKRRNSKEDNAFERKFKELSKAILTRVNKEVEETHKARESILDKFESLDAKINSMVELQKTVTELHSILQKASFTLVDLMEKVDKLEILSSRAEMLSTQSHMTTLKSRKPIVEENEEYLILYTSSVSHPLMSLTSLQNKILRRVKRS
ncbi:hypothetical protein PYW08_013305 [Mythimna loreyi]|uniref:Uncharacterized protein n=1 Tax=Mythimna loreyi TaxID=667449 RepID=A0ACC2QHR6_9NEOP|nr:hypothetical protein PYW08_013305 [Mythimna loreyi]